LAGRPGTFGVRFHNHLYQQLGLDFYYKAMRTDDLPAAVAASAPGYSRLRCVDAVQGGCMALVDEIDPSAAAIESVNTLVNTDGHLKAYNTDLAVRQLLAQHQVDPGTAFALRGSGGMAKAVASALRDAGFAEGIIVARNEQAGRQLADVCGYRWVPELGDICPPMLVNVTPIGMAGGPEAEAGVFRACHRGRAGVRCGGDAGADAVDPPGAGVGQAGDHRAGGDCAAGAGAVCAVHRGKADAGAGGCGGGVRPG
jgi:shikimate dehydrogenase